MWREPGRALDDATRHETRRPGPDEWNMAMTPYRTLALIDRACGDQDWRFADQPNAAHLERVARALADEYWSETAWLTGVVPDAAFRTVCAALERACPATELAIQLIFAADASVLSPALAPVPAGGAR